MGRLPILIHPIESGDYSPGLGRTLTSGEVRKVRAAGYRCGPAWRVMPDAPGSDLGTIFRPAKGGGYDSTSLKVEPDTRPAARLGGSGGRASGDARRGDSEAMRELARKRWRK